MTRFQNADNDVELETETNRIEGAGALNLTILKQVERIVNVKPIDEPVVITDHKNPYLV